MSGKNTTSPSYGYTTRESLTKKFSEGELRRTWDRCVADTLVKSVSGVTIGVLFSLVFTKRRPWPLVLGLGVGMGMGAANCQNDYNRLCISKKKSEDVKLVTIKENMQDSASLTD